MNLWSEKTCGIHGSGWLSYPNSSRRAHFLNPFNELIEGEIWQDARMPVHICLQQALQIFKLHNENNGEKIESGLNPWPVSKLLRSSSFTM
jgi:hypothetical protein